MKTVRWEDGRVVMIDQSKLPLIEEWIELVTPEEVAEAIVTLKVRGAPAIGVTAALGLALVAAHAPAKDAPALVQAIEETATMLAGTRPTAVNLVWGLERMKSRAAEHMDLPIEALRQVLIDEANAIATDDEQINRRIGSHGAGLLDDRDGVLTHCNAGALACVDWGTALGVVRSAWEQGKRLRVWADETRPLLQGARLTTWELMRLGIPVTLITDNMAGWTMRLGRIQKVVVGADRIAANGDVANKIGTYAVALLAREHDIPFYVAAPTSTIDMGSTDGDSIRIEERKPEEVTGYGSERWAPEGVEVFNPAFDVTPNALVAGIVTERGVAHPPFDESIAELMLGVHA